MTYCDLKREEAKLIARDLRAEFCNGQLRIVLPIHGPPQVLRTVRQILRGQELPNVGPRDIP